MSNPQTTPDWELRLGLIVFAPLAFVCYGAKGVADLFKEFWDAT